MPQVRFACMNHPKTNPMKSSFIASLLFFATFTPAIAASGLDQYLVARWTFNDGSLESDRGGHLLAKRDFGRASTLEFTDGAARLGPGALLLCETINSHAHPKLAEATTIWARVRIDEPAQLDCFLFGFRDTAAAGDWKNMTLAAMSRPTPTDATGFFSVLKSGAQVASGSRVLPVEAGRFVSIALVFDGAAKRITYLVDGTPVLSGHREATSLGEFTNLAVGRLKAAAGVAMTVDELRVYSVALSPEWVADIKAVK